MSEVKIEKQTLQSEMDSESAQKENSSLLAAFMDDSSQPKESSGMDPDVLARLKAKKEADQQQQQQQQQDSN